MCECCSSTAGGAISGETAEYEGFICPYCLIAFESSSELQTHFLEMHSDSDTPEAKSDETSQVSDVCYCMCVIVFLYTTSF